MIFKFCVSAAISCLVTILVYTIKANLKMQKQIEDNEREIHRVKTDLDTLNALYIEAIKDASWLRGIWTRRTPENSKEGNKE